MPRTATPLPFNRIGASHRMISVEAEVLGRDRGMVVLPDGIGTCTADGSLRPTRLNRYPYELRLGPFVHASAQSGIETGYRIARAWSGNVRVNHSCGFHVHLDMARVDRSYRGLLLRRWLTYEPLFWACVPAGRGENRFTMSLHRHGAYYCNRETLLPNSETVRDWEGDHNNRYHALNPAAYARHNTYEVRMQAGLASPNRACEWAYIVGRAMSMFASPNNASSDAEIAMFRTMITGQRWETDALWSLFKTQYPDETMIALMRTFSRRYCRVNKPIHIMTMRDSTSTPGMLSQNHVRIGHIIQRGYVLV